MTREAVRTYVAEHEAALLERAERLLSADTSNPPGRTAALADAVESMLAEFGLRTERIVADPAKPNLLATLPGASDRTLLFVGHLDTVPYDASAWTYDPLGERDGDRLYGRGATDMKGPLAAMLTAAAAFAETGTTPPVTLQFLVVSDEEVAGDAGLPAVLESRSLDADWAVIGETTCEAGRHSVTVADKGSVWLTLTAEGTPAHGSRPMLGENAIDRLYDAVETIRERFGTERFDLDPAIGPVVEESVAYYAPAMGTEAARDLFQEPTVNLGTIEGGEKINSVPGSARARLDIRLTAGVETADVLGRIRACVADCEGIAIEDVSWSVGTYEPADSPLVTAVAETAEAVTGERVYRRSATGGGDAKKLRNAGIPTVEFALGTDTVHAVDEYTTVEALRGNALVYASLPFELATRA
ncbi:M20 family metallopeptidase [Halorientalis marina]|uniref:M20 family metallopeptidase n=1 Tax=Halorientalis marina TaxID=2931976 RepID=UPI001FF421A7|nr:M20/M25/M40 family metallo-hydrolase [Halorientalis marina]